MERIPKELLGGQTEDYVEYSRTGEVVKGRERAKAVSKYDEDGTYPSLDSLQVSLCSFSDSTVFPGNHTSTWGSYYAAQSGLWGFACCHSHTIKSYCAGKASILAAAAEANGNLGLLTSRAEADQKTMVQLKEEERKGKRKAGDDDESGGAEKKKMAGDGAKVTYNNGSAPTEAEMGKLRSFALASLWVLIVF